MCCIQCVAAFTPFPLFLSPSLSPLPDATHNCYSHLSSFDTFMLCRRLSRQVNRKSFNIAKYYFKLTSQKGTRRYDALVTCNAYSIVAATAVAASKYHSLVLTPSASNSVCLVIYIANIELFDTNDINPNLIK